MTLQTIFIILWLPLVFLVSLRLTQSLWELLTRVKTIKARQWDQEFSNLFLFFDTHRMVLVYLGLCCIGPWLIYLISKQVLLSVIALCVFPCMPSMILKWSKQKRITQFEHQLPDSLQQIAGHIRAGSSLINALALSSEHDHGPVAQEFSLVLSAYRMGSSLESALAELHQRINTDSVGLTVMTAKIAQSTGGNLADSLDRLAGSLRQKNMLEQKIKALTSQGKLQGIVVSLLPVGIALILMKIEPDAMGLLWQTWLGYIVILLVCSMELFGYWSIKKIVNIDI